MSKANILYVDDEAVNLRTFKNALRREYNVLTASSGREGLDILGKKAVDVIIADQKMPEMSGVDFFKQVREKYPLPNRILLTGYADFDALKVAINEGKIFQYIQKPWEKEILVHIIEKALQAYRLEKENQLLQKRLLKNNEKIQQINGKLRDEVEFKNQALVSLKQFQKELQANEKRLIEAEKMAKLGYWELNPHTQEMLWSDGVYYIFNLKPSGNKPDYKIFSEIIVREDRIKDEKAYRKHLKNRNDYEIELRIKSANESQKYIIKKCRTIFDKKGRPLSSIGTIQDITEKKQLELKIKNYNDKLENKIKTRTVQLKKQRDKAQLYLDIVSVIIVVIDINRKVQMINKEGLKTLGYKNEKEIIGLDWYQTCVPDRIHNSKTNMFDQAIKKKNVSFFTKESAIITKSGEERIIAWKNKLLFDENKKVIGILRSGTDITDSKMNEKIIKDYTAELEMFNQSMLAREMRVIELKEEINNLARQTKVKIPYPEIWQK